jgi:hypothetical protein
MHDNEIWYTRKKKKAIIKIKFLETFRRCRTTAGRLMGKFQEKPQLYGADFKNVSHAP